MRFSDTRCVESIYPLVANQPASIPCARRLARGLSIQPLTGIARAMPEGGVERRGKETHRASWFVQVPRPPCESRRHERKKCRDDCRRGEQGHRMLLP
jgi:hypothetical protein